MTEKERQDAMREFSDLCDMAKAVIGGGPCVHTDIRLPQIPKEEKKVEDASLDELREMVASCKKCGLCRSRHKTVFGEGITDHPLLMVIGEGPGADEDATGRPFVGRAGQYLDAWLSPIGLSRDRNCFIGNIVKCRPPMNRTPYPEESSACLPFIQRQITLIQPHLILLSGATAAHCLLDRPEGVGRLRGQSFEVLGIPAVVTYHPAGVLRNPSLRAAVWADVKRCAKILGLPILRGR